MSMQLAPRASIIAPTDILLELAEAQKELRDEVSSESEDEAGKREGEGIAGVRVTGTASDWRTVLSGRWTRDDGILCGEGRALILAARHSLRSLRNQNKRTRVSRVCGAFRAIVSLIEFA